MARGRTARRRGRPRLTASTLPPGCRRHGRCIQATVRKHGHSRIQSFPLDTPNDVMSAWRHRAAAELELRYGGQVRPVVAGTFAADAVKYLRSVTALSDYNGRVRHIGLWVQLFGNRRRDTIKPAEIRQQRDEWLTKGPKRQYVKGTGWMDLERPLSPQTVCLRMRALENLWTVLDGPHAPNPVREVPEPRTPKARPRALTYDVIEAILAMMPDRGRGIRDQRRSTVSLTKVRLRLMAITGLTHSQLVKLKPADFRMDAAAPAINRPARGKGAGAEGGWSPVPGEALEAMRAFAAADAWGHFSRDAMRASFKRACKKLGLPINLTPYQLRHSFSSAVVRKTGDVHAAQKLLQHTDIQTTMGYVQDEIDPWLSAAMAKVKGIFPRKPE